MTGTIGGTVNHIGDRIGNATTLLLFMAGALTGGSGASAHHSYALYEMDKRITVTGTVGEVLWINPHAYFYLNTKDADGTVKTMQFFLDPPNALTRAGFPRSTLKPGDVISVEYAPAKGRDTQGFAWEATFPDGRKVLNMGPR